MNDLPAEIMMHIAQYNRVQDMVNVFACDRALHAYMCFEPLWCELYMRDFGTSSHAPIQSYVERYREYVEINTIKQFLLWIYDEMCDGNVRHIHHVFERASCMFMCPVIYYTNSLCKHFSALSKHFSALSKHITGILRNARMFKGIVFAADLVVMLSDLCAQRIAHDLANVWLSTMCKGDEDHLLDEYCDTTNTVLFLQGNIAEFACESNVVKSVLRLVMWDRFMTK